MVGISTANLIVGWELLSNTRMFSEQVNSSLLESHRENMSIYPSLTLTDCTLNVGPWVPKCGPLGPVGRGVQTLPPWLRA